jgi:hypothetical protein
MGLRCLRKTRFRLSDSNLKESNSVSKSRHFMWRLFYLRRNITESLIISGNCIR